MIAWNLKLKIVHGVVGEFVEQKNGNGNRFHLRWATEWIVV